MRLLASWTVDGTRPGRTIELLLGDLAKLPPEQAVDLLVVSAFPDDYAPTPTSLIGALDRQGLSVARLAAARAIDLREDFSCWLSVPVDFHGRLVRVLCVESGWRGTPPEITDDLFRALATASMLNTPDAVVAMPLIGTGDQQWPAHEMLETIVWSAVSWFRRGLPIRTLKIVVRSPTIAGPALRAFEALRDHAVQPLYDDSGATASPGGPSYDVFLSYSHVDSTLATAALNALLGRRPALRVFHDRTTLSPGESWLMAIAESLDASTRVMTLFTPEYWRSKNCKDEFVAAYTRQNDTGQRILYPVCLRTVAIPYMFRALQAEDCRVDDNAKLAAACTKLCDEL